MVGPNETYIDDIILVVVVVCGIEETLWATILIFPAEHEAGRSCKLDFSLYLVVQDVAYPPPCTHTTTVAKMHKSIQHRELGRLAYL